MLKRLLKRVRKRSIRARGTIITSAAVFGILWATGAIESFWLAAISLIAIVAASIITRRRNRLPKSLRKSPSAKHNELGLPRALISALPDPAVLMDRDGTILLQNERAEALFGGSRLGAHISSAVRAPKILDAINRVRQTGERLRVDHSVAVPIEQHFEVLVATVEQGGEPSFILLMRDLTRQERAERMRAEFVANASHELRTPLSSLLGLIDTLLVSAKNDPTVRTRFLDIMRTEAERMSRLIGDLLSLNRIELNAHVLPAGCVDVGQTVRHVVDTLKPIADEAGVVLAIQGSEKEFEVKGDRDELVQVFQNLVENAIKYGKAGKRVEIDIQQATVELRGESSPGVKITVRDFGLGIDSVHIPRLTERFYRVDKSHSREIGGTGLGLAIVKHILNRHRGTLAIDSMQGMGTTFTVALTLADRPAMSEDAF